MKLFIIYNLSHILFINWYLSVQKTIGEAEEDLI